MNLFALSDSYKVTHGVMLPDETEVVYSYLEARKGAELQSVVWFGLQYYLKKYFTGSYPIETKSFLEMCRHHFPGHSEESLNLGRFQRLLEKHGGAIPIRIKALPEGSVVPLGTCLMTVENTDEEFPWVTNFFETTLLPVWYPTTVASVSYGVISFLKELFERSSDTPELLPYMLHDFGPRGTSDTELSGHRAMGHVLSSRGTDTHASKAKAVDYYGASYENLAHSVPASEHSVMTSRGAEGEFEMVERLLEKFPTGILSVVSDSYDIIRAVEEYCTTYREAILKRDGKFVVRPDSLRFDGDTPADQVLWILDRLAEAFGTEKNSKGYKALNPKVGIIWGDGIEPQGIREIATRIAEAGYSPECCVYGMGGGLLQKVNRDTLRFAFKCSAQKQAGEWKGILKDPTDASKKSKRGRMTVVLDQEGSYRTITEDEPGYNADDTLLETVYENGKLLREHRFEEVRKRVGLI